MIYVPNFFTLILNEIVLRGAFIIIIIIIGVQLFYSVVLVSTVQCSGVPCAIQQVLIMCLIHISVYM